MQVKIVSQQPNKLYKLLLQACIVSVSVYLKICKWFDGCKVWSMYM